jgi:hypothetical protein
MEARTVVGLVIVALVVFVLVLMVWRIVRGNEQMQTGGSMGRQVFGRSPKDD